MSVCAKFQLPSWSRSDWKDCVWWVVVSEFQVATVSNPTKLLLSGFELSWVQLRWVLTLFTIINECQHMQIFTKCKYTSPNPKKCFQIWKMWKTLNIFCVEFDLLLIPNISSCYSLYILSLLFLLND